MIKILILILGKLAMGVRKKFGLNVKKKIIMIVMTCMLVILLMAVNVMSAV
jgi:hypothetical protein